MKTMVIALVMLVLALAGCGGGGDMAGLWIDTDYPSDSLRLNADGTGSITMLGREVDITWEVDEEQLCITYEDESGRCDEFELNGDRLTVVMEDVDLTVRYERQADE